MLPVFGNGSRTLSSIAGSRRMDRCIARENAAGWSCTKNGTFVVEQAADEDEDLGQIHGFAFPGQGELIAVAGNSRIHWRTPKAEWREVPLPDDVEIVSNVAVVSPDQIYIVADTGLLLFNGNKVEAIESPEGDLSGLVVRGQR
jgi:hypothetical protein